MTTASDTGPKRRRLILLVGAASLHPALAAAQEPALPYSFPVVLPAPLHSPAQDPTAPYSPLVRSLIDQLLPPSGPSAEQWRVASALLSTQGDRTSSNATCHNQSNVSVPVATRPAIMPLCFTDGLGINVLVGPNVGQTTGYPSTLALAASFNPDLANAMGQAVGREGRALMTTGLLGPQVDTDVFVNWSRGHHTFGEDPLLNGRMGAAQINGMQGAGLMAQVKHFAGYNGTADNHMATIGDQAFHEMLLTPYELALSEGGAASVMCAYQNFRVISRGLPATAPVLTGLGPFGRSRERTWQLAEAHFACEQPLLLNHVLRGQWKSTAFVGSDYGGVHSASGFLQGDDREDPGQEYMGRYDPGTAPARPGPPGAPSAPTYISGSTCADDTGAPAPCGSPGARPIPGIPGPNCPKTGCSIPNAVANGSVSQAVFKQSLARVLYQMERFGMLGCDNDRADCPNAGGVGADRSGRAPLPAGPVSGVPVPGTRNGNAAIAEQVAEQGAVLLKNSTDGVGGLPIRVADLLGGIAISGGGAAFLISNPNNEGATGFAERNAISPLQQLKMLSGRPEAFSFVPANTPLGQPIACGDTRRSSAAPPEATSPMCGEGSGLDLWSGTGEAPLTRDTADRSLDHSATGAGGRLSGGKRYRWQGWVHVDADDTPTFRIQHSAAIADDRIHFELDGEQRSIADATSFYHGQYYGIEAVDVAITTGGYVEPGLRNRACAAPPDPRRRGFGPAADANAAALVAVANRPGGSGVCPTRLAGGWHRIAIEVDARAVAEPVSVRLAWSRERRDIADAAAAAAGKAMAVVFVNDEDRNTLLPFAGGETTISALRTDQVALIRAVAAHNSNTVVVLNTGTPVIVEDWIDFPNVRAVLNMWHAGQEGGTATARLLLGLANPGGHTPITWPRRSTDTIQHYLQPVPLYPGDTPGAHPERANGDPGGDSRMTQGIYSGYRFYDKLAVPVRFPFGFGLSYSTFTFSNLRIAPHPDRSVRVSFDVRNTGQRAGATVAQAYIGPGKARPGVQQAVRSLRAFRRVELASGEVRRVDLVLDRRSFEYWNERRQRWSLATGERALWVGDADAPEHLPLRGSVDIR